ncbi:DUF2791 family P-loop domain-containing protein [candidate division WOR-3 bacterium]|nr:DUF2791 family P-loop domain-containing protein [candidate division WOR-3 bacterium]
MKRYKNQIARSIETVTHPFFGKGEVLGERWRGQELLVHFRLGITVWVPVSRLKIEKRERIKPKIMEAPPKIGEHSKREMLEAFKLGIVPQKGVLDFTYGREKEIEVVKNALIKAGEDGGGCLIVEGEYGGGKTHFLDYIYLHALSMDFAVCKVSLDPFDVTPYKPRRIYRELISTFLYKNGKEKNFRDFVLDYVKDDLLKDNRFFRHLKEIDMDEVVWDWITGEDKPRWWLSKKSKTRGLPLLPSYSTAADNYCYILSSIGWTLRKKGKKGLVVLIDEAETLFHLWWKTLSLEKGLNLIRGLALTALNDLPDKIEGKIYKDEEIGVLVEDLGDIRIIHRGVRNTMTPYIYNKPSGVFLVLAFTPMVSPIYRDDILGLLDRGVGFISLKRLQMSAYDNMFYRLADIYQSAFPDMKITKENVEELKKVIIPFSQRGVRIFLKATIDAFDIIRHYPGIELQGLFG